MERVKEEKKGRDVIEGKEEMRKRTEEEGYKGEVRDVMERREGV